MQRAKGSAAGSSVSHRLVGSFMSPSLQSSPTPHSDLKRSPSDLQRLHSDLRRSPSDLQRLAFDQAENVVRGRAATTRPQQPQFKSRNFIYPREPLSVTARRSRDAARAHVFRRFAVAAGSAITPDTLDIRRPRKKFFFRSATTPPRKSRMKGYGQGPNQNVVRAARIFESQSIWRQLQQRQ